jgi:hypothetical protein
VIPRGWIDVTGDMLRDAANKAAEIDPHDAHELRLEALSDGTLVIHALGRGGIIVVREADRC